MNATSESSSQPLRRAARRRRRARPRPPRRSPGGCSTSGSGTGTRSSTRLSTRGSARRSSTARFRTATSRSSIRLQRCPSSSSPRWPTKSTTARPSRSSCGCAQPRWSSLVAVDARRRSARAGSRLYGANAFVGLAPLALGSVILTRFDLWPAALIVGFLAALVSGRDRLGFGLLGAGDRGEALSAVLLPPSRLLWVARRRGWRGAAVGLAVFLGVALAIFIPFAVLSPGGPLGQPHAAARPAAADREPRLGTPPRRAPARRSTNRRSCRRTARRTSRAPSPTPSPRS